MVVAEDVPAAAVEAAVREGGGELLTGVVVFDLYRGEQVGEGRKSLALRLEFRAPGPDSHRRRGGRAAGGDRGSARRAGGCPACLTRCPWRCSAPPASAARSARGWWTATRARAGGGHRPGRGGAPPRRALPALRRGPGARGVRSRCGGRARRGGARGLSAQGRGAAVAELRSRGVKVVDLSADFRARPPGVRALVPVARGSRAARGGRLRATGSAPRGDRRRTARGRPGLQLRPPRSWPMAAARARSPTPSWTSRRACRARAARPPRRPTTCPRPTT